MFSLHIVLKKMYTYCQCQDHFNRNNLILQLLLLLLLRSKYIDGGYAPDM